MTNPTLIPIPFATSGMKNDIQKNRQATQDESAATYQTGWTGRTMIPKESGGLPPDGRDFNGLFYVVTDHLFHRQNGEQIKFDPNKVSEIGGYGKGTLIQSDDTLKTYRSLIDNNGFNPNTQPIANRWEVYAGKGSIPVATSTTAGVMKVINNLVSTDTASALSAAQGKQLLDWLDVVIYSPIPYPSTTIPSGFIRMQGQTITQAQYPKLFALYGSRLPDMRGEFIRGLDGGRGVDSGRTIRSSQSDELKSHSHQYRKLNESTAINQGNPGTLGNGLSNVNTTSFGGSETRPRNIAFNYIVKAG